MQKLAVVSQQDRKHSVFAHQFDHVLGRRGHVDSLVLADHLAARSLVPLWARVDVDKKVISLVAILRPKARDGFLQLVL